MLNPLKLTPLSPSEIRPAGWLKRQLEIQAEGLSGNLDLIWPDVRDSRWIGGDCEGWERVPYWLDGFIPLAYLLDRDDLKARAKKYVDAILAQQDEDGWICPCTREEREHYDMWALFLIGKVLVLYADCAGDERVEPALMRAFRQYERHLDCNTVYRWGAARWFEALIPIFWLYERTGEEWLLRLAFKLEVDGMDYEKLFRYYQDQVPVRKWTLTTHVVNLAMSLKSGALVSRIRGGDPEAFADLALSRLMGSHSMAVGHFSGDECSAGDSPIQGSELCGVAEAMYSYEHLLQISGSPRWADLLEKMAFNALPATISTDMWTHQYDQQTNQVQCSQQPMDHVVFGTNSGDCNMFGLEPGFGCCTANFNQAWPKLAMNVFMRSRSGILCAMLLPAVLNTTVKGAKVRVAIETEYPFRHSGRITVETDRPVTFELKVRVPRWAKDAALTGGVRKGDHLVIKQEWQGSTALQVTYTDTPHLVTRPRGMKVAQYGPLVFALPVDAVWEKKEYVRDGIERKFPYCDYEVRPTSQWRYGFAGDTFEVVEGEGGDVPFSAAKPRLALKARLAPVDWDFADGYVDISAEKPKNALARGPVEEKLLVPYGAAKLRITEMVRTK